MKRKSFHVATLVVVLFFKTGSLFSSTPQFLEFLTQEELLKGSLEGVSLTSDGKITLAPTYEMVLNTGEAYLFSIAADRLGDVYVGSGHNGKVFKLTKGGAAAGKNFFFKAKELDVYALAVDSQNNLYVGSSPDGKVYKVSPEGTSVEFFDPKEKYIWAMTFDKQSNLYVATGGRGVIYKVDKEGKGAKFFESQETHIMSLVIDLDGNLIAGSSPNAYIYRISPQGKGFVLYDSPLSEIRALALDRFGNIYAAALNPSGGEPFDLAPVSKPAAGMMPMTGRPADASSVTVQVEDAKVDSKLSASLKALDKDKAKSAVHELFRDGSVETVWTSKDDTIYSVLARPDGTFVVSTGTKGRLLLINAQREASILVESSEEQVTTMLEKDNTIYAVTSNLGKVFHLKPKRAAEGAYTSDVKDSKTISSWGKISWSNGNPRTKAVELYSRSGNTEKPNKTWSDWSGPYMNPEGEPISSPRSRYIQWKAVFKADPKDSSLISQSDALEKVSIAYLQQNIRPRITSINILPPGIALQKMPVFGTGYISGTTSASLGGASMGGAQPASSIAPILRPKFKPAPQQKQQPGARSIMWKGEDDNDDDLVYQIYFKAEGEQDWKLLEKELTDEFYTIDSNTLPDGIYQIKIHASDAPSNPYGKGLTADLVSKPFIIDNTPPIIEILSHKVINKKVEIDLAVRDQVSRIIQTEFSIDGGEWRIVFPRDGISDSKSEQYSIVVDLPKAGEHTIGLKATDAMGNVGSNKLLVKLPRE